MAFTPRRPGHSVLAVANEFLRLGNQNRLQLTPMHLQKLCYYAQGFSLAYAGKPIIHDQVEAWDFGPVFPTLYEALKKYGSGPVVDFIRESKWSGSEVSSGNIVKGAFTADESYLINDVYSTYAHFEAFQLSALTNKANSPWAKVYRGDNKGLLISNDLIKDYFNDLAAAYQLIS